MLTNSFSACLSTGLLWVPVTNILRIIVMFVLGCIKNQQTLPLLDLALVVNWTGPRLRKDRIHYLTPGEMCCENVLK